jgi:G:T-mismatch repair DNA endonuclease (very short patch repair protein)
MDKGSIKNNTDFWDAKIERNILRDEEVNYDYKRITGKYLILGK